MLPDRRAQIMQRDHPRGLTLRRLARPIQMRVHRIADAAVNFGMPHRGQNAPP
jgi:hypothetical protein